MTTTNIPSPPPKPPAEESATSSTSTTTTTTAPTATSPPKNSNPKPISENPLVDTQQQDQSNSVTQHGFVPYKIPEWSGPPCHKFYFEVLQDGSIVDQFDVCKKGAYMFGRAELCDFVLEHPTISGFHAVIQFKKSGDAYLYDVGSTHGTFINKNQVQKRVYVDLHVGDVVRFGQSSRLYIFQGPSGLMPPLLNESQLGIMGKEEAESKGGDELAESLNALFTSISTMVKSELQGTNNTLELLEKMNLRVADEYKGFGDVASGLRVFVEQLKSKSSSFDEYVQQIDAIEQQVTQFEVVISMLDKYVSLLESKMQSMYQHQHPPSSS
ncbi:kanadaptin [Pistacia vera]|uniref:kanadaptin n=1 Tax=Pistacia vera TaxID=55513 RepID=UPI0012632B13|nr:kanadaptin [Pistacia vera]